MVKLISTFLSELFRIYIVESVCVETCLADTLKTVYYRVFRYRGCSEMSR